MSKFDELLLVSREKFNNTVNDFKIHFEFIQKFLLDFQDYLGCNRDAIGISYTEPNGDKAFSFLDTPLNTFIDYDKNLGFYFNLTLKISETQPNINASDSVCKLLPKQYIEARICIKRNNNIAFVNDS